MTAASRERAAWLAREGAVEHVPLQESGQPRFEQLPIVLEDAPGLGEIFFPGRRRLDPVRLGTVAGDQALDQPVDQAGVGARMRWLGRAHVRARSSINLTKR